MVHILVVGSVLSGLLLCEKFMLKKLQKGISLFIAVNIVLMDPVFARAARVEDYKLAAPSAVGSESAEMFAAFYQRALETEYEKSRSEADAATNLTPPDKPTNHREKNVLCAEFFGQKSLDRRVLDKISGEIPNDFSRDVKWLRSDYDLHLSVIAAGELLDDGKFAAEYRRLLQAINEKPIALALKGLSLRKDGRIVIECYPEDKRLSDFRGFVSRDFSLETPLGFEITVGYVNASLEGERLAGLKSRLKEHKNVSFGAVTISWLWAIDELGRYGEAMDFKDREERLRYLMYQDAEEYPERNRPSLPRANAEVHDITEHGRKELRLLEKDADMESLTSGELTPSKLVLIKKLLLGAFFTGFESHTLMSELVALRSGFIPYCLSAFKYKTGRDPETVSFSGRFKELYDTLGSLVLVTANLISIIESHEQEKRAFLSDDEMIWEYMRLFGEMERLFQLIVDIEEAIISEGMNTDPKNDFMDVALERHYSSELSKFREEYAKFRGFTRLLGGFLEPGGEKRTELKSSLHEVMTILFKRGSFKEKFDVKTLSWYEGLKYENGGAMPIDAPEDIARAIIFGLVYNVIGNEDTGNCPIGFTFSENEEQVIFGISNYPDRETVLLKTARYLLVQSGGAMEIKEGVLTVSFKKRKDAIEKPVVSELSLSRQANDFISQILDSKYEYKGNAIPKYFSFLRIGMEQRAIWHKKERVLQKEGAKEIPLGRVLEGLSASINGSPDTVQRLEHLCERMNALTELAGIDGVKNEFSRSVLEAQLKIIIAFLINYQYYAFFKDKAQYVLRGTAAESARWMAMFSHWKEAMWEETKDNLRQASVLMSFLDIRGNVSEEKRSEFELRSREILKELREIITSEDLMRSAFCEESPRRAVSLGAVLEDVLYVTNSEDNIIEGGIAGGDHLVVGTQNGLFRTASGLLLHLKHQREIAREYKKSVGELEKYRGYLADPTVSYNRDFCRWKINVNEKRIEQLLERLRNAETAEAIAEGHFRIEMVEEGENVILSIAGAPVIDTFLTATINALAVENECAVERFKNGFKVVFKKATAEDTPVVAGRRFGMPNDLPKEAPAAVVRQEVSASPVRVLLIDDSPEVRENFTGWFTREKGAAKENIFQAGSVEEALTLWESEGGRFDVVLLDLELPETKGGNVVKYSGLKAADRIVLMGTAPVFYITSYNDEEIERESRKYTALVGAGQGRIKGRIDKHDRRVWEDRISIPGGSAAQGRRTLGAPIVKAGDTSYASKKALIVDDNPEFRSFVRGLLLEWGFKEENIFEAEDGYAGLEVLAARDQMDESERIDVTISDIKMPRMNGFEFAKKYSVAYGDSRPLIIVTASYSNAELAELTRLNSIAELPLNFGFAKKGLKSFADNLKTLVRSAFDPRKPPLKDAVLVRDSEAEKPDLGSFKEYDKIKWLKQKRKEASDLAVMYESVIDAQMPVFSAFFPDSKDLLIELRQKIVYDFKIPDEFMSSEGKADLHAYKNKLGASVGRNQAVLREIRDKIQLLYMSSQELEPMLKGQIVAAYDRLESALTKLEDISFEVKDLTVELAEALNEGRQIPRVHTKVGISISRAIADITAGRDDSTLPQIEQQIGRGIPDLLMTEGALFLALREVIENAVSFATRSEAEDKYISVSAEKKDGYIVIKVFNTGEHIPADALPHIFEDSFTTRREENGLGQGLAIAWNKITINTGYITAANVESGVEFEIRIPIPNTAAEADILRAV